ncbi:MAG TPA: hypothetical protein VF791_13810 [Pyrinomonadaceae bacterium]
MAKTIISAFDDRRKAARLLDSAIENGFDSRCLSVINPAEAGLIRALMAEVPGIQVRLYQQHLRMGDCLLVAQVTEADVPRLIKLLQSTGGHHIEAFDQVKAA